MRAALNTAGEDRRTILWPLVFSFMGHLLLFGLILYAPSLKSDNSSFLSSAIDVQLVEMPANSAAAAKPQVNVEKNPPTEKTAEPESVVTPEPQPQPEAQAEVSVAPEPPKNKTALKYKTFKSQEVLKNALENIEKKIETSQTKPLEDALNRLRKKVASEGKPISNIGEGPAESAAVGNKGGFGLGSRKEGELIDMYRLEIAFAIQKNWALSEQLVGASKNLEAKVVFKVMPDGRIEDVFFTDRSGNTYLDDSAYKAIIKTSPVKPFPPELNRDYIEMGLRFTPGGIQ